MIAVNATDAQMSFYLAYTIKIYFYYLCICGKIFL